MLILWLVATILLQNTLAQYGPLFWPYPKFVTFGRNTYTIDPCKINYKISTIPVHLIQIKQFYLIQVFKCTQKLTIPKLETNLNVTLTVIIKNTTLISPFANTENYTLNITQDGNWNLKADYFPGFLRGFQTFSQLFKMNNTDKTYYVQALPIQITDFPEFQWRGILVDTARHFMSVDSLKRTIDACMFNKINIFHWHITDEDSFPIQIDSHPQLSKYGSFKNKTYSKTDVRSIVQYALRRGVRVIPQIDSPAHTQSWGRSPELKDIVVTCEGYEGQFDPTNQTLYKVLEDVMREINSLFIDPVVHFGGDEVDTQCWDLKPQIKVWMIANNINTYQDLEVYYRKRQKSIWRTISNKSAAYWANEDINLPTQNDDYIHWWGNSQNAAQVFNRNNSIILSFYDQTYLDIGFGGAQGEGYGNVQTWLTSYSLNPRLGTIKGRVVGGEACLWAESNNQNTHMRKLWLRGSALAERFWNSQTQGSIVYVANRLSQHGRRLRRRGISISPITVGLCELQASFCYV